MKKKKPTLWDMDVYHQKKHTIPQTILSQVRKNKSVVYGQRALNEHLPPHLDRYTDDYDVYSKKPKKSAKELEKKLDKQFGGDYFVVKPAKYKHTYKVKSKVTGKTVADFTRKEKSVKYKTSIDGVNYVKLKQIETKLKRILRDKKSRFRWKKDKDMLRRIRIYKKVYKM
jgi:hypothetical protein